MYRPPPLRGRSRSQSKKILLIDLCQATREVRAAILRDHGIEVHEVEELSGARFHWQPKLYDLVMLDVRRYSPGEILEFYEQIKDAYPLQSFAFLMGPPNYISRTWPGEAMLDDASSGQWDQVVTAVCHRAHIMRHHGKQVLLVDLSHCRAEKGEQHSKWGTAMTTQPKQLGAYLDRSDWSTVQPRCRYPHQGSCGV